MRIALPLPAVAVVVLAACAGAPKPHHGEDSIAFANRALSGAPARIEFAGGRTVERAEAVRLDTKEIEWKENRLAEKAALADVVRVTRLPARHVGRDLALGAGVGVLLGMGGSDSGNSGQGEDLLAGPAAAEGLALSVALGAGIGALVGLHRTPGGVVFEQAGARAPTTSRLAAPPGPNATADEIDAYLKSMLAATPDSGGHR